VADENSTPRSWDDAFDAKRLPRPGEQLLALIRASNHLSNQLTEADLINAILTDAVVVLDAQDGAIALADTENQLQLRAVNDSKEIRTVSDDIREWPRPFSRELAERPFRSGQSILLGSDEAPGDGLHDSVVIALMCTVNRRVGVLYLGRNLSQKPFNEKDLFVAHGLAAILAGGIENFQIREPFKNPVMRWVARNTWRLIRLGERRAVRTT